MSCSCLPWLILMQLHPLGCVLCGACLHRTIVYNRRLAYVDDRISCMSLLGGSRFSCKDQVVPNNT